MVSIFEFLDYKTYIIEKALALKLSRGWKSQLAKACRCQMSYVSQVLNGKVHFSLEQALVVSSFFKISNLECEYFMEMVNFQRAGNERLKEFYARRMNSLAAKGHQISQKFQRMSPEFTESEKLIYYSCWTYPVVHMCVWISNLRTSAEIARKLNIAQETIEQALHFLVSCGMIVALGKQFVPTKKSIHLERPSPYLNKFLTGSRIFALKKLDLNDESDLFYSSIVAINQKALIAIKNILVESIDSCRKLTESSTDEDTLMTLNIDFSEI